MWVKVKYFSLVFLVFSGSPIIAKHLFPKINKILPLSVTLTGFREAESTDLAPLAALNPRVHSFWHSLVCLSSLLMWFVLITTENTHREVQRSVSEALTSRCKSLEIITGFSFASEPKVQLQRPSWCPPQRRFWARSRDGFCGRESSSPWRLSCCCSSLSSAGNSERVRHPSH